MILPEKFETRMKAQLGLDDFLKFSQALESESPTSIRLNPTKLKSQDGLVPVEWCQHAYYLKSRPNFAADPLWHAGAYYVQEASSMMLEQAFLKAKSMLGSGIKVLDLCAAPGGKTTHLASLCDEDDVLVANEVIKSRVAILSENIKKHGYSNVIITNADSSDFEKLGSLFDVILVDAPCSGEGLFRKDQASINEWSLENIQTCELRQKRILDAITQCLKPNGILIYSTCTYNPGENLDQVEQLIQKGFSPLNFSINGKESSYFQCYPHQVNGEGFFMSMLQNQNIENPVKLIKNKKLKHTKPQEDWAHYVLPTASNFIFENKILGGNESTFQFFNEYLSGIYCTSIGSEIGEIKEKRFALSEYLPFSSVFNASSMHKMELSHLEALQYIAKNPIMISSSDRGYVCLTF